MRLMCIQDWKPTQLYVLYTHSTHTHTHTYTFVYTHTYTFIIIIIIKIMYCRACTGFLWWGVFQWCQKYVYNIYEYVYNMVTFVFKSSVASTTNYTHNWNWNEIKTKLLKKKKICCFYFGFRYQNITKYLLLITEASELNLRKHIMFVIAVAFFYIYMDM